MTFQYDHDDNIFDGYFSIFLVSVYRNHLYWQQIYVWFTEWLIDIIKTVVERFSVENF